MKNHKFILATTIAALLAANSAQAADQIWSGGSVVDGNWGTVANWDGAVPGSTSLLTNLDIALFNAGILNTWGNAVGNPVVIDSATQNIGGINFSTAAGSYFIGSTGGNALLLSSGGTIQILSTITGTNVIETINAPLVIEGANGIYTFANNSANGAGAGAGTLVFGGAISGGAAGATVLTLGGSNTNANLLSGVIGNGSATTLGLLKTGVGSWTLNGSAVNTFTGATQITRGTLRLDFANLATPTNLINSASVLTLGGGTLNVTGKATATSSQTFASTTFNAGANTIVITRNGASGSATLALNALTRNTGSMINFQPGTGWGLTASTTEIVTTTGINGGALPGANSFIGAWATQGTGISTRYVQLNSSGQFVAAPSSTALTAGTAANMTSVTTSYTAANGTYTLAGNLTGYAFLANNTAATIFTIGANTLTMNGMIAINSGSTTFSGATGAGGIVVGVENELVINAAAGAITLTAPISNKPANASSVTIGGGNQTVVTGAQHLYTGGTTLAGANSVATVSSVGTVGNPTSGPFGAGTAPLNLAGGTIRATTAAAITVGNTVTISNDTTFPNANGEKDLTFSGPVTLTGGNRTLTGNVGAGTLNSDGTGGASGKAVIFSGVIGDGGNAFGITKAGTGTIRLSAANTYTGPTTITGGTLQIGAGGATGSLSLSSAITTNATLGFNRNNTLTQGADFAAVISGTGGVSQVGAGGITLLNGTNTFTGNVSVTSGTLSINNSSAIGAGTKTVTISGTAATFDFDTTGGSDITLPATVSFVTSNPNGAIRNTAGTNAIGGTISLSSGGGFTKVISNGGALALNGNIATITGAGADRTLILDGTSTGANIVGGNISNAFTGAFVLSLEKQGAGTWTLSGNNTYTGPTTLTAAGAGTLKAGSTTALSSSSAFTVSTGTLDLDGFNNTVGSLTGTGGTVALGSGTLTTGGNNASTVFNGAITGIGGLTKDGAGTFTLSSAAAFSGATAVNNGTLQVDSTFASTTVTVGATGTLAGVGPLAGAVSASGTLSPATATTAGTLTIGSLTLNAGSTLTYEFGGTSDLISVTTANGLNIAGGALSLFAAGGVTPLTADATYTLFNYVTGFGGSLSNLSVANPQLNKFYQVADDLAGNITITLSTTTTSEWNGAALDGLWTTSTNWTAGTPNSPGSVATLGTIPGAPTSIAVDGAKTIGTLIFNSDDANPYTVTGGVLDTLTFNNGIAAGIINVADGGHTISAPVVLASNLSVTPAATTALTISGEISGTKGITKSGAGTLTLSGANLFTGPVTISGGVLAINAVADGGVPSELGQSAAAAANLVLDGGTLQFTGASDSTNRDFTITSGQTGTIEITTSATSLTLSGGAAATTGALTKAGPGKLILTGSSAYTGLTTVSNGVLNIRSATALGTTGGGASVTAGAVLEIEGGTTIGAEALTLNGDGIASAGALRSISGVNIYGGLLTLGGNARINTDADSLALTHLGTITGPFTLTVGGAGSTTIDSVIGAGVGTLTKDGGGALTLTATNTFTGGVMLNSGTLNINRVAALGGAAGTFTIAGGTIDNTTAAAITTNAYPTIIDGDFAFTGTRNLNLGAGAKNLGTAAGASRTITVNAGTLTLGGVIANGTTATQLIKAGPAILALTGANTFNGGLTIKEGTVLTTGGQNSLGDAAGTITLGDSTGASVIPATLDSTTANVTSAHPINVVGINQVNTIRDSNFTASYSGAITLTTANLTLDQATTAAQIYSGGITGTGDLITRVTGTGGSITLSTAALNHIGTVTNNGTGAGNTVISSVIDTNVTGVTQNSATSRLILTGANAYTGPTLISAGTLQIGNAGTTGSLSPSSSITDNATLSFNRTNLITQGVDFASAIAGTGALTQAGSGTVVLNGVNTYDGLTTVSTGALNLQLTGTPGSTVGATTVANNARLELEGGITVSGEALSLAGNGLNFFGALQSKTGSNVWTGNITMLADQSRIGAQAGSTLEVSGVINTGANLYLVVFRPQDSTATVIVSGANTYAGPTGMLGGVVSVGSLNSVVGGTATSNLGAPTTVANGTIQFSNGASATLRYTGAGETTDRVINLAGTTFGGAIEHSGAGLLKFTSDFTATGNGLKTLTLQGSLGGTGEIAGAIVDSTSATSVTKAGTGMWTLSGTNFYTGLTTVNGGTLALGHATNTLADTGPVRVSGGTLAIGANSDTVGAVTLLSGSITGSTGVLTGTGYAVESGSASAILAGAGVALTKTTGGTVTLTGANTYTGVTTLSGGLLNVGSVETAGVSGPLGNSAAANPGSIVMSGGTLQHSAANQNDYSGRFSTAASQAFNVDTNGQAVTWASALISAAGTLSKSGLGTLTLTNAGNTYSGVTSITGGVLSIAASGNLGDATGSNSIEISGNATLRSTGAAVDLGVNRSVAIGVGDATVDVTGANDLTIPGAISGTGKMLTKIGTGTLNLDGAQTYGTLKTQDGTTNVNGDFTGGIVNANATTNFTTSQTLNELNIGTVALAGLGGGLGAAVVPEPGSLGLLIVGALGLAARRRRSA